MTASRLDTPPQPSNLLYTVYCISIFGRIHNRKDLYLALFGRDQNTMFIFWFDAVPFHIAFFTTVPEFDNKPTCAKIGGKAPVKVNNHGYPGCYTLICVICGPVTLILPHPGAESVKCISIFMCVFPHTFYVLLSDRRVKMSRGSTWSRGYGMSIGYRTQISNNIKQQKTNQTIIQ